MEARFCFTLDTEPDDLWADAAVPTFEHFRLLLQFHRKLVDAGARLTYLTTSEVVESAEGRRAMESCLQAGHCEVGAHFHTWTRDWPFSVPDLGSPRLHAMAHQLGQPLEERMLDFTCRALRTALGIEARAHRGGRWSLGPSSARSLANCGIVVDSSVTPGLSWRDTRSPLLDGPDYRFAPSQPFWLCDELADDNASSPRVLEIPVGAAFFPARMRALLRTSLRRRVAARLGRTLGLRLGHRWLRPTKMSVADMRAVMIALKRAESPVWIFMIHSSEIIPCTPLPTQAAVDAFWQRCLGGIRAAVELGAKPSTLSEAAELVIENNDELPSFRTRSDFRDDRRHDFGADRRS
jgi:hypothetical protein